VVSERFADRTRPMNAYSLVGLVIAILLIVLLFRAVGVPI
jgi:hypothetical protein